MRVRCHRQDAPGFPSCAGKSVLSDDLHILLIDPDDDDRTLTATLLRGRFAMARIETVATAAALATSLARGGFDVVVAEYRIPWIEGPALLDAIKGRWCMNRTWPARIPPHRHFTYRWRTTLAFQAPSSD